MKRPQIEGGFRFAGTTDEVQEYITACHKAMWLLIRLMRPGAGGNIWSYVEELTEDEENKDG